MVRCANPDIFRAAKSEESLLERPPKDPKRENFDRLLGELKGLLSQGPIKPTKAFSVSHESVVSETEAPVVPKPIPRKPGFQRASVERSSVPKMFKPIRSEEITPSVEMQKKNLLSLVCEEEETGSKDKTIHDSLRMPKAKRRPSLPCFEKTSERNENPAPSYYSTWNKGEAKKTEYYSSFLSSVPKEEVKDEVKLDLVKSASDECVYNEARDYSSAYSKCLLTQGSVGSEDSGYRRISVTEPSSPVQTFAYPEEARPSTSRQAESELSETESDSTDPRGAMKKSRSFAERNLSNSCESLIRDSAPPCRKLRTLKAKVRKQSASSTSSYDSPFRIQLRKSPKARRSDSEEARRMRKSTSCHVKNESSRLDAYWSEDFEKGRKKFAPKKPPRKMSVGEAEKCSDFCPVKRERAKSWNRELDGKQELGKITPEVYLYLLQILTQGGQTEGVNQAEFFTKSLPRNHRSRFQKPEQAEASISRHLNDALKCEKDCLKILKSVSKENSDENAWPKTRGYCKTEHMSLARDKTKKKNEGKKLVPAEYDSEAYQRKRIHSFDHSVKSNKTVEVKRRHQSGDRSQLSANNSLRVIENSADKDVKRKWSRKQLKKMEEECVIRIEDGNLWIEICKAVQETESKDKKVKKTFVDGF